VRCGKDYIKWTSLSAGDDQLLARVDNATMKVIDTLQLVYKGTDIHVFGYVGTCDLPQGVSRLHNIRFMLPIVG